MADGITFPYPAERIEEAVFAAAFVLAFDRCAADEYGRHAALVAASVTWEQYRLACYEESSRRAEKKEAHRG